MSERLSVSVSSAVFIENENGDLLLLRHTTKLGSEDGYKWGPPAGGIEAHEDPLMAAIREVKEEIGVDVKLQNIIGIYSIDRGNCASGLGFTFRGRVISGKFGTDGIENDNWQYFQESELTDLIEQGKLYKPEYNYRAIIDWMDRKSYPLDVVKPLR